MKNNSVFKAFLLTLSLVSCKNKVAYINACYGTNLTVQQQQHVHKSSPVDGETGKHKLMNYQHWYDSAMGLCSIENGFSDLQIRLLYEFAHNDTSQYIIFTKQGTECSAQFYKVLFKLNSKRDSLVQVVKLVTSKAPLSSWQSFFTQLMHLQIMTLPDYSTIANYPLAMDANNVTIQTATSNSYSIYSYAGPEGAQYTNEQAAQVMQILRLIEKEFSIEWLYQNKSTEKRQLKWPR